MRFLPRKLRGLSSFPSPFLPYRLAFSVQPKAVSFMSFFCDALGEELGTGPQDPEAPSVHVLQKPCAPPFNGPRVTNLPNALQVCPRSHRVSAFYRPTGVSALCLLQRQSANTILGGCFLVPYLWHRFRLGLFNVSQSQARCSVNPMTPAHFTRSIVGYRPSGWKDSGTSCQSRQMVFAFSKSLDRFIFEIICQGS